MLHPNQSTITQQKIWAKSINKCKLTLFARGCLHANLDPTCPSIFPVEHWSGDYILQTCIRAVKVKRGRHQGGLTYA